MLVFIIAMNNEAEPLIDQMKIESDRTVCGKRVVCGKLFGMETGVVICGVGKVNAACGTQYAIDCLNAKAIINLGVAGGLNNRLKIGGLYRMDAVVQYDFDLTQINGTEIGTLDECKNNYLPLFGGDCEDPVYKLATGDRFNDSKDDYRLLTNVLNADVRDMECGAIAQVCMHAEIPCLSYKIISDLAGNGSTTEQFSANLELCFKTLKRELKNIADSIKGIEI